MANPPDPSNVKLLCHFDGSNGQTTTVDSSLNARTLTAAGAALSTTQSKFGGASSTSSATTARWTAADSADWSFGSGQFTVEAWVYFTTAPGSNVQGVVTQWATLAQSFFFGVVSGSLAFYYSTDSANNPNVGAAWTPALNTWYHIAADRDTSNVLRVYLDGAVYASSTVTATFFDSTSALDICGNNAFTGIVGFVDDLRVVKGEAVYGGAFTRPSVALPNPVALTVAQSMVNMDLVFGGQPFVTAQQNGVTTGGLDVALLGRPFVSMITLAASSVDAVSATSAAQTANATAAVSSATQVAASQAQTAAASAAVSSATVSATSEAQSVAATASAGIAASSTTSQGQMAQATAGVASTAAVSTSEAQSAAASAAVSLDGVGATSEAQSTAATAAASSAVTAATAQAQSASALGAVGISATAATSNAQGVAGQLSDGSVSSAASVASANAQAVSAAAGVGIDARISTGQGQRVGAVPAATASVPHAPAATISLRPALAAGLSCHGAISLGVRVRQRAAARVRMMLPLTARSSFHAAIAGHTEIRPGP